MEDSISEDEYQEWYGWECADPEEQEEEGQ
jgi:hypothetical protein